MKAYHKIRWFFIDSTYPFGKRHDLVALSRKQRFLAAFRQQRCKISSEQKNEILLRKMGTSDSIIVTSMPCVDNNVLKINLISQRSWRDSRGNGFLRCCSEKRVDNYSRGGLELRNLDILDIRDGYYAAVSFSRQSDRLY